MIRDDISHEVDDDGGMLFGVQKTASGSLSAQVRVWGHVTIDGEQYSYDKTIRVRLIKEKPG